MEFSIATLLSSFTDDKSITLKALEKKLGLQDEDSIERLQIALDALEKIGLLIKERGRYRRHQEEHLVEAKLRCSSKGFCFAIQTDESGEDIYVRESHLSNAWNGDRVLVQVTKEGTRRRSPEGQVKVILERANPSILARVKHEEDGSYRALPLDDRLLSTIDLQPEDEELLTKAVDHLVHVEVLRYPLGQYGPLGRVARVLGSETEAIADTDIVCCKHDLRTSFSPELVDAAREASPHRLTKSVLKNRLDLKETFTFTVADEDELVQETAFSLERLEEQWRLGIHITDVAHYIEADSPLDREARRRVTAVHLGGLKLPLFPEPIINSLGLLPGKSRLTISVLITFDQESNIQEYAIRPSVVEVDRCFTYAEIQALLNQEKPLPSRDLGEVLQHLFFSIGPVCKAQRRQRGSFEVLGLDLLAPFQDDGRLGVIGEYPQTPVRSLLAELIILANQTVTEHLQNLSVPTIYCVQSPPDAAEVQDLIKLGQNLQLDMHLQQEEEISSLDYQKFSQEFSKSKHQRILHHLLQNTLRPILFRTKPGPHFGLAIDTGYSRCTYPLSRYGDLLVQRLLHAVAEQGKNKRTARSKEEVDLLHSSCRSQVDWQVLPADWQQEWESTLITIASHLNDREKVAIDAELDWRGLNKADHMRRRTGEVFTGLITGVQSYGFFVEIEELLVQGLVHVSSLKDDWYEYRSRYSCLVGRKNRTAYRLGDETQVQVKNVDYYRQQIDLATYGEGEGASLEELEDDEFTT